MHLGHLRKDVSKVMRPEDNPAVRECLRLGSHEAKPVKMIDPQQHLGGALEIVQALNEGNIVCMMGDRSYGLIPWRFLSWENPPIFRMARLRLQRRPSRLW
jgi:lauroyl/myristoyl acyltransferase